MKRIYVISLLFTTGLSIQAQEIWDLKRCIDYAIEHNLSIKQQEDIQQQNEIEVSTAKWNRLPNLNGGVSHSFNFGRSIQADNTYKSLNTQNTGLNLSTSVPLFTGMQLTNNIALAKLNLKAAVEDLNKAKEDISIQVTSNYLQVLFNKELSKIAHEQVMLSKEILSQKEAFFANKKISKADLYEAKSRVAQDELSAVQAENNYKLSLLDLSQLLELPNPDEFEIAVPETDTLVNADILMSPVDIYAEAIAVKPTVKAAQYRLEGAQKNIRIAQSAYYPQLSLSAGLSTNYYNVSGRENGHFGAQLRDNFSQYIGFSLSVPIFNRFATRNRVRNARIQQHSFNLQLEEVKKNLYKEIQQAYYNAINASTQYASSRTANQAAQLSFNLIKEKYIVGKANSTEYNEARTIWMKAISDFIQAKYDYLFRCKILDFYRGIPLNIN
ncbi:MAG TPA: TolC family protein [Candidatus Phocaeicola gallistercoris]|nr:TolC family protein [Candidatus Phocaeicola gallistercoris]